MFDRESGIAADVAFECDNLDAVQEQSKADNWGIEFTQLEIGRFEARYAAWTLPMVRVLSEVHGRKLAIAGTAPHREMSFVIPKPMSGSVLFKGELVPPGSVAMVRPGQVVDFTTLDAVDVDTLQIDASVFDRAARTVCGDEVAVSLDRRRVLSPGPDRFAALSDALPRPMPDGQMSLPSSRGQAARADVASTLIERLIVAVADSAEPKDLGRAEQPDRAALVARRARDFIEANLHRSISRETLCRTCGTKMRRLHYAFLQHYGISPIAYSRFRRIQRAHDLLKSGHPEDTTVTTVATASGFWHFGRFAVLYKSVFGESPSETLAEPGPMFVARRQPVATPICQPDLVA